MLPWRGFAGAFGFPNVPGHPVTDRGDEIIEFRGCAFCHEPNPPIVEILHETGDIVAFRDLQDRIAKPDALDMAGEMNGGAMGRFGAHGREVDRGS